MSAVLFDWHLVLILHHIRNIHSAITGENVVTLALHFLFSYMCIVYIFPDGRIFSVRVKVFHMPNDL